MQVLGTGLKAEADPKVTYTQRLLATRAPCSRSSLEGMAEWCTRMAFTYRHRFLSSVIAWAEIDDSQSGHCIAAANFNLDVYSFPMTYPITFIKKFLCEKFPHLTKSKNIS